MAFNGYARMDAETLETTARILAKIYRGSNNNGTSQNKEECDGIVQVAEYTKADGTKVDAYERICPYHYQGNRTEKKDESDKQSSDAGFSLNQNFSSDSSVNRTDVINLKTNLAKRNYYHADAKSEKNDKFHGYPNDGLVTAIKQFQRDNGITPDGRVLKGSATEAAINSKFESHGVRFEYPVNTDEKQVAVFDGTSLSIYENGKKIKSWDGMSGKPEYQSARYQHIPDKGPLPEGTYVARQSTLQFYKDISTADKVRSELGGGSWRGGTKSWGQSRVWLEPAKHSDMLGRKNFTIHGGKDPGSLGCIDLTSHIDDFTKWFEKNKKDVILQVRYIR